jgi:hypothetical protein
MESTKKQAWAQAVLDRINATDPDNLTEATLLTRDEVGEAAPTDPFGFLAWLRGDEPADAYESGDAAEDYADHLATEWDLYGPEGE